MGFKIYQNGKIETSTCLRLPYTLHQKARKYGVNMSRVFVKALEQEIERCEHHRPNLSEVYITGPNMKNENDTKEG
jgi:GTP cyclohydrolase FolE2